MQLRLCHSPTCSSFMPSPSLPFTSFSFHLHVKNCFITPAGLLPRSFALRFAPSSHTPRLCIFAQGRRHGGRASGHTGRAAAYSQVFQKFNVRLLFTTLLTSCSTTLLNLCGSILSGGLLRPLKVGIRLTAPWVVWGCFGICECSFMDSVMSESLRSPPRFVDLSVQMVWCASCFELCKL